MASLFESSSSYNTSRIHTNMPICVHTYTYRRAPNDKTKYYEYIDSILLYIWIYNMKPTRWAHLHIFGARCCLFPFHFRNSPIFYFVHSWELAKCASFRNKSFFSFFSFNNIIFTIRSDIRNIQFYLSQFKLEFKCKFWWQIIRKEKPSGESNMCEYGIQL